MGRADKEELDEFIVKLGDHPRSWIKRLPYEVRELAKKFDLLQGDLANRFDELIEENIWKREDVVEALECYGVSGVDDFIFAFWELPTDSNDLAGENHFKFALDSSGGVEINDDTINELINKVIKPLYELYTFWICFKSLNNMLPDSVYPLSDCRGQWYSRGIVTKEWLASVAKIRKELQKAEKLHASILKMIGGEKEVKIKNDPPPPSKPGRL